MENTTTLSRRGLLTGLAVTAVGAVGLVTTPPVRAVPLIGGYGLVPNADALAGYIQNNYPGVISIGGVRPDWLPDHPSGHALDLMVGGNTKLGNAIAADLRGNMRAHGIKYILWQVANHYDHVHVTVY